MKTSSISLSPVVGSVSRSITSRLAFAYEVRLGEGRDWQHGVRLGGRILGKPVERKSLQRQRA